MKISGHKTRAVFDRYHIVSTDGVTNAMRRLELNGQSLVKANGSALSSETNKPLKTKTRARSSIGRATDS
jgi:hypothetical protein